MLIASAVFGGMSDSAQPAFASLPGIESLIGELYRLSGGEKFGLTQPQFLVIVHDIGRKYLHGSAGNSEVRAFYLSLRVEELALARACAAGSEHAWETFLIRYREKLYDMALHIAREDSAARDLADSLYADLYGTSTREGQRISKLASYTGRGSLEGWLRTVLAQEYVNRYRRRKRLVSLDEEIEEGSQFAATDPVTETVVDPRLESSTDEALTALPAEDRFILTSYYLDELTLATIAQTLGVHESTISRKLDKLAKSLRKQILAGMARRGMSRRQAQEALETDIRDLKIDIRKRLSQDSDRRTFPEEKAKARATDGSS
jgi:RNA polymerase sigma-70 factor (ECF subfamily)